MKLILLAIYSITGFYLHSQITTIPDANFEQALIDLGLDTGSPDGQISTNSIDTVTMLNVSSKNISDLTGIEDFTSLQKLICGTNPISSINVSNNLFLTDLYVPQCQLSALNLNANALLEYLYCANNQITSLDLSFNPLLSGLECQNNQLIDLNITQNTKLYYFDCGISNQLTSLDVSHCDTLRFLYCDNNNLQCLNVKNGNNNDPMILEAFNNPSLTCIEVDDPTWATSNWTVAWGNIDPTMSFSSYCGNSCTTGIDELVVTERTLIKTINLMGQEINNDYRGLIIRLYNDGSIEKTLINE